MKSDKIYIIKTWFIIICCMLLSTGCQDIDYLNFAETIISPQNNIVPLEGTWRISDYRRISDIEENEDIIAQSKKSLGKLALFTNDWAQVINEKCSNTQYQIRRVDAKDYFLFLYNIDSKELGIDNDIIEIISITSEGALFFDIIKIEDKKAILYMDRCFYWLEKVSEDVDESHKIEGDNSDLSDQDDSIENGLKRSGILIGLRTSTPQGDNDNGYGEKYAYRTIWISSNNNKLETALETPNLFVPRRSGFWLLNVSTQKIGHYIQDHINLRPAESLGIHVHESIKLEDVPYFEYNIKKKILFVGDDYISIEYSKTKESQIKEPDTYKVLPLDDANSEKGILISSIADEGMEDIFYKSAQSHLISKGRKLKGDLQEIGQEDNFTLARRSGHWVLRGRLNMDYGKEDFTIGLMPTGKLVNYDRLALSWNEIKEKIPMAIDAYTSPNNELLIVVTSNYIMVYSIKAGEISDKPMKKIGLKMGETVIMAEWATGDYVARWDKSFSRLNPYLINE